MARFTSLWCMSPSTEILTIGALGFVHAATQCYWYFGDGKTDRILGSMDTKGHFTAWEDKIIKSALHGMEFMKNALTPLHLLSYLLMFHALWFKKSPARMVPWLLLGALKDVALGAVLTLSEAFICYVVNLPRPCAEVTIFLITELALQLYLWGSTLLLYQELANREIAAEGEAYWASAASTTTPVVVAPSESASPSEWEAAPAGLRSTTPKRPLEDSAPSLPDRHLEHRGSETRSSGSRPPTPASGRFSPLLHSAHKHLPVHSSTVFSSRQVRADPLCSGVCWQSACSAQDAVQETRPTKKRAVHGETGAAAGSRTTRPRANKAVQANTLSRRWLLANANAPRAAPKMKESTSPRARRSAARTSAEGSGAGMAQSRSQYAHRDVSPRAAAAWADDADDTPAS